jgi:hypothetical protein
VFDPKRLANALSNPEQRAEPESVRVFSGENSFETTSSVVEPPGPWYFPPFAALITAAGRLLLALLECCVRERGGSYMLCDTDSLMIVASEHGGLVPCEGGKFRLADGREAVKALMWQEVREIVEKFGKLNPYDPQKIPDSILRIEDINFENGVQRELRGWAIAAKRYVLFSQRADGTIKIEKASAHGLGFLHHPQMKETTDAPGWVIEAWEWVLRGALGMPRTDLPWFTHAAMMRVSITTPNVLREFQKRTAALPYRERAKPFNFCLMPILDQIDGYPLDVDHQKFTLIGPFNKDPSRWLSNSYINIHDGKTYRLAPADRKKTFEACPKLLGDYMREYVRHSEAKSLAPNGEQCTPATRGLLQRTPVTAGALRFIGKETDRRWEQGEDISIVEYEAIEYSPGETQELVTDAMLSFDVRTMSIRVLAKAAGVSANTVKAARRGERLRRTTVKKLRRALRLAAAAPATEAGEIDRSIPQAKRSSRRTSREGTQPRTIKR